ncbi:hypothetical protein DFH07DRAFT_516569 [Mycena maculata]|uniref:Uncharacterized protein n=1 Tax=Mycena maculata TaxID=230809 RepID=A0AAD7IXT8_9AGAR|nr:hypothetical protein DFH07DRAFT_516569 [Mycena maculata]
MFQLTSLIRSSSLTSKRVSGNEERPQSRRRSRKVTLDYVKQEMLDDIANERASRPTKPNTGILNLITHSRSRSHSRSKGGEEAVTIDTVAVPELPADSDPQNPHLKNVHKPPTLLQSRPLSAATTNTASTVTPVNVTPRKRVPSRIPGPIPVVQEEPTPAPKQAQGGPKKNFHIFGIPLPSPKKSVFGSRPGSPSEASPALVRRKSSPSSRRAAATSPTPKSGAKLAKPKPAIGEGPPPQSKLDNLSKFFVGTGMRVSSTPEPTRPASKPTPSKIPTLKYSPVSQKTGSAHVSPGAVAHISPSTVVADSTATPKAAAKQPSRQYMSEVGNIARVHEPVHPPRIPSSSMSSVGGSTARVRASAASAIGESTAHVRSSISNPRASILGPRTSATGSTLAPTPRVRAISTGAGQSRSAIGVSTRMSGTTTTTTSSLSTRERRVSTDSSSHAYRAYRPTARLGGIEEDRWKGKGVEGEADKKITNSAQTASGRPSANGIVSRHVTAKSPTVGTPTSVSIMPTATVAKSTIGTASGRKHGSFDFERPGWGPGAVKGAASSLGTGSRARRDPMRGASGSVDGRAERGTGAGLAGVGAARLYTSTSAAHRTVRVVPPPTPPEQLQPDHTGGSTSTSVSQSQAAGTSSWGRSTGKRLSAGLTKLTNGLGLGKSSKSTIGVGKERQHGKFAFEPPVPAVPTSVRREQSIDSQRSRERERQWEREERERRMKPPLSGNGHNASHSTSSTSSTHTGVSAGHRSGTKGRSLDLGLGLAWAPTKVREDAVMPESSFGRSLSASRREQQGKEIADVFRNTLDEDGYRSFKKYVHRFDAHEIPFDGPTGIVTRVERLLRKVQHIDDSERARLLDSFVKLILQNA